MDAGEIGQVVVREEDRLVAEVRVDRGSQFELGQARREGEVQPDVGRVADVRDDRHLDVGVDDDVFDDDREHLQVRVDLDRRGVGADEHDPQLVDLVGPVELREQRLVVDDERAVLDRVAGRVQDVGEGRRFLVEVDDDLDTLGGGERDTTPVTRLVDEALELRGEQAAGHRYLVQ
jgi:hypothetical protein